MTIEANLDRVVHKLRLQAERAGKSCDNITLVVVTKGRSVEEIAQCYKWGVRDFGENRVEELLEKKGRLPDDIRWHFIGKLQRNKVKKIVGMCALIHSVDTLILAEKISQISFQEHVVTPILLEVNTSGEPTKGGLQLQEWRACYSKLLALAALDIQGLMTMAPLTRDESIIRACFRELNQLKADLSCQGKELKVLSMGMSNDYPIAIDEGATVLRIGSAIFGP